MNYEVGKYYTFDFKEKHVGTDGNIYLHLTDPENPGVRISVKPYSFQQDWEDIAPKLECYCYKQDVYGKYRFAQSLWTALNYMYGPYLGHFNEFVIEKRIETEKENVNCCRIKDTFGFSQLYYPKEKSFWDKYHVGDSILLYVTGIHPSQEGKNNAFLVLKTQNEISNDAQRVAAEQSVSVIRDESLESLGVEDDHTEFKASIVFPAEKKGKKDMATQLAIIMRSIAGFMNKDGGTLYIGVNDSGEPFKDIKEEFQYLNDDENDNYTYRANEDHYKIKLNNKICWDLGSYAASLATVNLKQANGVTYAAIEIKKSESVVWYHGTELYVRCDNATRRMTGDNITKFIISRVNPQRFYNIINQPVEDEEETTNEVVTKPQEIVEDKILMSQNDVIQNESAWRYVSLFKDGTWSFHKTPCDKRDELIVDVPIPQKHKSHVMMIAYASGKINAVNLKDLLYGTGRNKNTLIATDIKRKNGVIEGQDQIINVFCMKKGGLLLVQSVVENQVRVKAHKMEVVGVHQQINAMGNMIIPEGALTHIAPVEADSIEKSSIEAMGIVVKDYERYHKNGVDKEKLQGKYQELIDKLLKATHILKEKTTEKPNEKYSEKTIKEPLDSSGNIVGKKVVHKKFGVGEIAYVEEKDNKQKICVLFRSDTKYFNYPDAFEQGFLSWHETDMTYKPNDKGLKVIFRDGTVVSETTAVETFKKALMKIGLSLVASSGIKHGNGQFDLVSKEKSSTVNRKKFQHKIGDYYIFVNLSNNQKKIDLQKLSKMFDLGIVIEEGE